MFRFLSSASARHIRRRSEIRARLDAAATRTLDSLSRSVRDAAPGFRDARGSCQNARFASTTSASSAAAGASGAPSGVSSGAAKVAAKAGAEIPSFAESLQKRFGTTDGRDFVLLTAGLALAGLVGERILSDRRSAAAAKSHHPAPSSAPSPSPSDASASSEPEAAAPEAAEAELSLGSADAGPEEVIVTVVVDEGESSPLADAVDALADHLAELEAKAEEKARNVEAKAEEKAKGVEAKAEEKVKDVEAKAEEKAKVVGAMAEEKAEEVLKSPALAGAVDAVAGYAAELEAKAEKKAKDAEAKVEEKAEEILKNPALAGAVDAVAGRVAELEAKAEEKAEEILKNPALADAVHAVAGYVAELEAKAKEKAKGVEAKVEEKAKEILERPPLADAVDVLSRYVEELEAKGAEVTREAEEKAEAVVTAVVSEVAKAGERAEEAGREVGEAVSALGETLAEEVKEKAGEAEDSTDDCPFCQFMKGGPCREEFIAWEGCVEAAEKAGESIVDRCVGPTEALKTCMEGNEGYYGVVLQAEAGMKAEAAAAVAEASAAAGEVALVQEAAAVVEAAGEGGVKEGVEGRKSRAVMTVNGRFKSTSEVWNSVAFRSLAQLSASLECFQPSKPKGGGVGREGGEEEQRRGGGIGEEDMEGEEKGGEEMREDDKGRKLFGEEELGRRRREGRRERGRREGRRREREEKGEKGTQKGEMEEEEKKKVEKKELEKKEEVEKKEVEKKEVEKKEVEKKEEEKKEVEKKEEEKKEVEKKEVEKKEVEKKEEEKKEEEKEGERQHEEGAAAAGESSAPKGSSTAALEIPAPVPAVRRSLEIQLRCLKLRGLQRKVGFEVLAEKRIADWASGGALTGPLVNGHADVADADVARAELDEEPDVVKVVEDDAIEVRKRDVAAAARAAGGGAGVNGIGVGGVLDLDFEASEAIEVRKKDVAAAARAAGGGLGVNGIGVGGVLDLDFEASEAIEVRKRDVAAAARAAGCGLGVNGIGVGGVLDLDFEASEAIEVRKRDVAAAARAAGGGAGVNGIGVGGVLDLDFEASEAIEVRKRDVAAAARAAGCGLGVNGIVVGGALDLDFEASEAIEVRKRDVAAAARAAGGGAGVNGIGVGGVLDLDFEASEAIEVRKKDVAAAARAAGGGLGVNGIGVGGVLDLDFEASEAIEVRKRDVAAAARAAGCGLGVNGIGVGGVLDLDFEASEAIEVRKRDVAAAARAAGCGLGVNGIGVGGVLDLDFEASEAIEVRKRDVAAAARAAGCGLGVNGIGVGGVLDLDFEASEAIEVRKRDVAAAARAAGGGAGVNGIGVGGVLDLDFEASEAIEVRKKDVAAAARAAGCGLGVNGIGVGGVLDLDFEASEAIEAARRARRAADSVESAARFFADVAQAGRDMSAASLAEQRRRKQRSDGVLTWHARQKQRASRAERMRVQALKAGDQEAYFKLVEESVLKKIKWHYVIVDEGHRLKNHESVLSKTLVAGYSIRKRLLLTGTPIQNSLGELWALLNFLLPAIFNSSDNFEDWFNAPFADKCDVTLNEEEQLLVIRRLHQVIRPFILRRKKSEVEKFLPQKRQVILKCDMSAWQREYYSQIVSADALDHPYQPQSPNERVRASGKFELLDRILPKLQAAGHRILMFSQMTKVMDLLEDYLRSVGMLYLRLDGMTKTDERGRLLQLYNAPDSPYFIFLLSTRAGGLGLNLQTADTVILFDSDWNPQMDQQAEDRAHRIGQKREVRVFVLVSVGSIEEEILERAKNKMGIDAKVIQAGMFNTTSTAQERRELLEQIMKRGKIPDLAPDLPDESETNRLIARTEEEFEMFERMDEMRRRQYGEIDAISGPSRRVVKHVSFQEPEDPYDIHHDVAQPPDDVANPLTEVAGQEFPLPGFVDYESESSCGRETSAVDLETGFRVRRLDFNATRETHYVIVVHGTFDAPPSDGTHTWYQPAVPGKHNFCSKIGALLARGPLGADSVWRKLPAGCAAAGRAAGGRQGAAPYPFHWDGTNTHKGRVEAAEKLALLITDIACSDPAARIHIIAHSHGGNVLLKAVELYIRQLSSQSPADLHPLVEQEFWAAHRNGYDLIRKWRSPNQIKSRWSGWRRWLPTPIVFQSLHPSTHKHKSQERYPWGRYRWLDSLLGLPATRQRIFLSHRLATSPLSNALGSLVFLGTPFYVKKWDRAGVFRLVVATVLSVAAVFGVVLGYVVLWEVVVMEAAHLEVNRLLLWPLVVVAIVGLFGIISIAVQAYLSAESWLQPAYYNGNIYHAPGYHWSPAMSALVVHAGKLDEASLALSVEPIARAYVFPELRNVIKIVILWNAIFLVPFALLSLISHIVAPALVETVRSVIVTIAFGLSPNELSFASVYVDEVLDLHLWSHHVEHWNVQKLLAEAKTNSLQGKLLPGYHDDTVDAGGGDSEGGDLIEGLGLGGEGDETRWLEARSLLSRGRERGREGEREEDVTGEVNMGDGGGASGHESEGEGGGVGKTVGGGGGKGVEVGEAKDVGGIRSVRAVTWKRVGGCIEEPVCDDSVGAVGGSVAGSVGALVGASVGASVGVSMGDSVGVIGASSLAVSSAVGTEEDEVGYFLEEQEDKENCSNENKEEGEKREQQQKQQQQMEGIGEQQQQLLYEFLWNDRKLEEAAAASGTYRLLRSEMRRMKKNPRLTDREFVRQIKQLCMMIEEHIGELTGRFDLNHGAYFRDPCILAVISHFLQHRALPDWSKSLDADLLRVQSLTELAQTASGQGKVQGRNGQGNGDREGRGPMGFESGGEGMGGVAGVARIGEEAEGELEELSRLGLPVSNLGCSSSGGGGVSTSRTPSMVGFRGKRSKSEKKRSKREGSMSWSGQLWLPRGFSG
ncbi:unnamed protein product [Closterium sp. Yama58-4]|nr:unnamed protein product [Closterium sp. Yama58-4]